MVRDGRLWIAIAVCVLIAAGLLVFAFRLV